jgi:hypothetical protein
LVVVVVGLVAVGVGEFEDVGEFWWLEFVGVSELESWSLGDDVGFWGCGREAEASQEP